MDDKWMKCNRRWLEISISLSVARFIKANVCEKRAFFPCLLLVLGRVF